MDIAAGDGPSGGLRRAGRASTGRDFPLAGRSRLADFSFRSELCSFEHFSAALRALLCASACLFSIASEAAIRFTLVWHKNVLKKERLWESNR